MELLLLFLVGLITSFAANITGGGAALIILPVLVGFGLSPIDAIGTNMLGALGFVLGSAYSQHARGRIRYDHIKPMIVIVTVASILGPTISIHLSQPTVKTISGLMIVTTAIVSLLTWKMSAKAKAVSSRQRYLGYFLYFATSILVAGFASGVGLLSNFVLIGLVGMSAIETIITRQIAGLIGVPIQLFIYATHQHVDFKYGIVLAIACFIGAHFGINFAILKGSTYVKRAMAITAILLVLFVFLD